MEYNPKENPIVIKCHARKTLPIDALQALQGELKKLTRANRDKLMGSICEKGFIAPFFIWDDAGDYRLLDGHQRLKTLNFMREKGWQIPSLPVVLIEADSETDAKEKLLLITSQYGEFTLDGFEQFTDGLEISTEFVNLASGTFKLPEQGDETLGDDEAPDVEKKIYSKLGKVYNLGKHRLMCGDATKAEDVKTLMAGETADLWLTDPPYNVALGFDESPEEAKKRNRRTDGKKVENDKQTDTAFQAFLIDSFKAATEALRNGGVFYIWHADSEGFNFRTATKAACLQTRECLIWNKNCMVMGRQDYQWKHEPCLYGWKEGAAHYWTGGRCQTTVLENGLPPNPKKMEKDALVKLCTELLAAIPTTVIDMDKPSRSAEHPTMKPVALFQKQIENSSAKGEIVLDTFAGSGTTLIACEKVGRRARLMELDPAYCDVIRRRWTKWADDNGIEAGPDALEYEGRNNED